MPIAHEAWQMVDAATTGRLSRRLEQLDRVPVRVLHLDLLAARTRFHVIPKWAVRIIPKRKVSTGEVDLDGVREAFDGSYLIGVQKAIEAKSVARFAEAYKFSLEGCYSCHKTSEKPYLRLQVPAQPEVQIVNFDPNAKWPQ